MVEKIRTLMAVASLLLLGGGFLCSEWASFHYRALEYAEVADSMPVRLLALLLLVGAIASAVYGEGRRSK